MAENHGGNLDFAISIYGGSATDWLDLSTGINRIPYENLVVSEINFFGLPDKSSFISLINVASNSYNVPAKASILPIAGVQMGIQAIPHIKEYGIAKILSPTYNEYHAALKRFGWKVLCVKNLNDLNGADLAVVVNPNNPDGRTCTQRELLKILPNVGKLIVDESYCDPTPELSMVPHAGEKNLIIFKSIGKFFGLAGIRLGFVIGQKIEVEFFSKMVGPWSVSGPALEVGRRALSDIAWIKQTRKRLNYDATRFSHLIAESNLKSAGSTMLFHLIKLDNAKGAQIAFAEEMIWTRIFSYSKNWLRIGLPGTEDEWLRLAACLKKLTEPLQKFD